MFPRLWRGRLTWRSLAEYRRELDAAKIALNTVQFIGHNTLRSSVMGYAARTANLMVRLLENSLDEGGFGLTTGLAYQLGKYSDSEEVTALARATYSRQARKESALTRRRGRS